MSMAAVFYTGDRDRIVDAVKHDDVRALVSDGIVVAEANFPFQMWPEDLDGLVRGAGVLLKRPVRTFAEFIQSDFMVSSSPNPSSGISEMSGAFAELFASIPWAQVDELYDLWFAEMKKAEPVLKAPPRTRMQRLIGNIGNRIQFVLFSAVVLPIHAIVWLVSPGFRRDSRRNRAKLNAREGSTQSGVESTKESLTALINTCKAARDQQRTVLYGWTL